VVVWEIKQFFHKFIVLCPFNQRNTVKFLYIPIVHSIFEIPLYNRLIFFMEKLLRRKFFEMSERCNISPRFSMKFLGRCNISRTFDKDCRYYGYTQTLLMILFYCPLSIQSKKYRQIPLYPHCSFYQKDMGIDDIFAEDVLYTESWCPQYSNRKTVKHWFSRSFIIETPRLFTFIL